MPDELAAEERQNTQDLLDLKALASLPELQLAAHRLVEGLQAGLHKSKRIGASVEFADHRAYVPGDDLRYLDWKVLGRTDRLIIRRYEAETDLNAYVLVDSSASMEFQGPKSPMTKRRYACILAATLATLIAQQQDRIGAASFSEQLHDYVQPAQHNHDHIMRLLAARSCEGDSDQISECMVDLCRRGTAKGLVFLISDFMHDLEDITKALQRMRQFGHQVMCLWVLDESERNLSISAQSRFEGLEGGATLQADPRALRDAYAEQVQMHEDKLRKYCTDNAAELLSCTSSAPILQVLRELLAKLAQKK